MDAAKLADELRSEQENAQILEKEKRDMEARTKDLQVGATLPHLSFFIININLGLIVL